MTVSRHTALQRSKKTFCCLILAFNMLHTYYQYCLGISRAKQKKITFLQQFIDFKNCYYVANTAVYNVY